MGPQLAHLPMAFPRRHGFLAAWWLGPKGQRLRKSHVEAEFFYHTALLLLHCIH